MVSQSPRHAGPVTLMLLTLLLLIPTPLFAETACEAAEQTLLELQRELQQLRRDRLQWQSLLNGQVPAPHQLDALLGQPLDTPLLGTTRKPAPREAIQSHCPARQDDISATLEQLAKLDRQLYAQRMALMDLPLQQRQAFLALSRLHAALQTLLDNPASSPGIRHDALQLQAHITRVWRLLGAMDNTPGKALTTLDQAWYHTPKLMPPSTDTPAYRDLIHLRLEIQKQIRTLRSELWQRSALPSLVRAQGGLTSVPELLAREVRQLGQRLRDTASLIRHDLSGPARKTRYAPLAQNILALMLGTACFVLLVKLARRSRGWALAAHDKVVSASGEKRWLRNASRLISGLAPMLPWLLLWFILEQLNPLLNAPATKVLHWLLPFAYLYVFYGLLCLVGEWLIGRVAQSAGSYLSSEQTREILTHSHTTARWLMVPWFPVLVVWESLGPSLLYYLLLGLLMVSLFRGLGHLLALRREDYLLCLQALLPSYLDPVAEKLLTPALFWLFAPLLLPVALVSFLVGFVDRVLTDFDWYKRLQARWFRLRTRTPSEDEDAQKQDQESAREHYEQWFAQTLPEDSKHPFIDTGLVAAMEKHVQRWHDDKTDENALVVTGEKGSGKSMSLTRLEKSLEESCPDLRVVTLKVPAKSSDPEQIMALIGDALDTDLSKHGPAALVKTDEHRKPVLVILDEAQHFFLARQGGLEGWRSILSLVNSKLDNVFWLLTINNQSWAYLCNIFGREYQFRNVVRVKPWGQSDIRSLILSRNHLSGYQVRYDEVLLSSRGPEAGNVRNAEQRYFSLLWDACRGNPMVALRLWLTSVKVNGRQVTVGLPTPPSASVLDTMGENALFVYAAIATHGDLSSHEISEVTCLAENVVRYALKGGLDAGFLRRTDDARYRMVPLWYQPVISYLTRKNLLNE